METAGTPGRSTSAPALAAARAQPGDEVTVAGIMTAPAPVVGPDCPVSDVAARMALAQAGAMVVLGDAGHLLGLFTERDLLARVVGAGLDPRATPVADVMSPDALALDATTPVSEACRVVAARGVRHVPVSEGGRVVGLVALPDLLLAQLRAAEVQLERELASLHEARRLLDLSGEARARALLQVNERLRRMALTDELTGLHNHRYLVERLASEVSRSVRHGLPLSMLFVDIDHFKRVNDTYGHPAGDQVLRAVAGVLREGIADERVVMRIRRSDVVARYGGEEFAVLLPMTSSSGALVAAERIRAVIEAASVRLDDGRSVRITVSVGVATAPDHAGDDGALLRAADGALYEAKQAGRNRVTLARVAR